jgi:hypothetical protein
MRRMIPLLWLPVIAWAEQPLPVYPGAVHTRIGNDLLIGGELYRLAYFHSRDSVAKIAEFFKAGWLEAGYPVSVDGDLEQQATVSAFYTREGLVRSVVLTRFEGKTLGFTALKDLWVHEAVSSRLPKLEGALFSQDVVLRDEPGGSFARSSLLTETVPSAAAQVLGAFSGAGYALARDRTLKSQRVLEFARGDERAWVGLAQLQPGVVAAQLTWRAR